MAIKANRAENIHYVYEHWRPDKDVCFYVGKGSGRRINVMYNRNTFHQRIQAKLARLGMCVEVRLVKSGLTHDNAIKFEIERIAFWLSMGVKLANLSSGGEGNPNPSKETRQKMRRAKLGRKLTDEHKEKIRASTKTVLNTPEKRDAMSAAQKRLALDPIVKANRIRGQKKRGPRTKEHYEKVAAALRGKKCSPEAIEKSRRARMGMKQSPESIAKRIAANKGRKRSPEFCQQMKDLWTEDRRATKSKMTSDMRKENPGSRFVTKVSKEE
jgi:hypothetical protein